MRTTWLASVVTMALLGVMLLGVGATSAKTPGWQFIDGFTGIAVTAPCPSSGCGDFTTSPTEVSPGAYAAFDVTIANTGRSNISALFLATDLAAANPAGHPVKVFPAVWTNQAGPDAPCGNPDTTNDQPLACSFGALNAGASVTVKIVFRAPSSSLSFNFLATGNGNTSTDGGTSHGDTLKGRAAFSVNASSEFAGGFVLDAGTTFSTVDQLGRGNPQSSAVTTWQQYSAATVEDSDSLSGTDPCLSSGVSCIGQWARVSAPNGSSGPIRLVLHVYGKGIPGSVGPEDIVLFHLGGTEAERGDDGIIGDEPSERCASPSDSAGAPCIYVTREGRNFLIVAWLLHNGSLHGAY